MSIPVSDPTPVQGSIRGPFPEEGNAPAAMDHHEKARVRQAAFWAKRVYPGPVGEMVSRELLSWEDFGHRLGGHSLVMQVVADVLSRRAVEEAA